MLHTGCALVGSCYQDSCHPYKFKCKSPAQTAWLCLLQILSALQRASFIVLSYPFGADMLSLMATAARGCGSADAGNLEDFSYSKMTADSLAAPAPGDWRMALKVPLHMLHQI